MLYLDEKTVRELKPDWKTSLEVINRAVKAIYAGNYTQPIKPYLRFGDHSNRIIAMPAFLGFPFQTAGIKWIASFPGNLEKQLPRAHSLTILNDPSTGKPIAVMNSSLISGLRTAAITGLLIQSFIQAFHNKEFNVGLVGVGPIGRLHIEMLEDLFGEKIKKISVFDKNIERVKDLPQQESSLNPVESWQKAYQDADLFLTCTTSSQSYINIYPKPGSLHLNISLRDYCPEIVIKSSHLVVDDWDEVCRENTDIENAHKSHGLNKSKTLSFASVIQSNYFSTIDLRRFEEEQFAMFHPMGMGLFDMALSQFFYDQAIEMKKGIRLED